MFAGLLTMATPQLAVAQGGAKPADAMAVQIMAAIDAAKERSVPGSVVQAAAAIVEALTATHGGKEAGTIASIAIVAATGEGGSPADVGSGLGQAAAHIMRNDPVAAIAIARTVANEGIGNMGASFAAAVTAAGGPESLAAIAVEMPRIMPETGPVPSRPLTAPPLPPPCRNPSCS